MEIRYITDVDDKFEISRIYEESWKFAYKGIIPQSFLDSIPNGKWCENLEKSDIHSLVLIENGKFIGTSSFCKSRFQQFENCGEIVSIYFLPEYIGKGYGKKLMNAVIAELEKFGFHDIFLWVLEDNKRARAFYEKFGFMLAGQVYENNIGGRKLREVSYLYHIF